LGSQLSMRSRHISGTGARFISRLRAEQADRPRSRRRSSSREVG
jgi:hypothetical protein